MSSARNIRELVAYQLAVTFRREVIRSTRSGPGRSDFDFVRQIRNSARGGPRNVAEGFSRMTPAEFNHFLSYAKASIDEAVNHIVDGHESGYFTDAERDDLIRLAKRTLGALRRLMSYLESPAARRACQTIVRHRAERAAKNDVPRRREPREP